MCYTAVGEAELWCNAGEVQAQPEFHYGLSSNSHISAASAWVQMAGWDPAGLEVENYLLRI